MDSKTFFNKVFPLGSHLCREPMPRMPELKHDMELLKSHGFNLVKLQEHWMVDEPLEGCTDFSRYEELIAHAAKLDMGVYLGLTCEQAPGWLYRKYPTCRMVGRDGSLIVYESQTTLPADGKPGPCYDHPGALADMNRFITRLVETLGRYDNLVVWNTWQEIGYWANTLVGQHVCYCENTLNEFRKWLAGKYGDLDGLNRAWNMRYADWSSVQPDRGNYQVNGLPHDVDWRYFMDNVQVANVLKARYAAIRAADPQKRPIFAHKGGPAVGFGQDWTYARCQDFLGSSSYPAWSPFGEWDDGSPKRGRPEKHAALLAEMWNGVALTYDTVRSASERGKMCWAAEFQGGPVSTFLHKGRVPSAEDIRRWMLTAVSSGVSGLSFWVTRAEIMAQETNGFSLLDSEGENTPRLQEAGRIGAALNKHAELFNQSTWAGAKVAILVNEWNAQLCHAVPPAGQHLVYSTRGWHRLLWEMGIPADFLEAADLDQEFVHQYAVIIMPFPLSISEEIAAKLARWVEAGGVLISEAAAGRIQSHGECNRGELSPALRELFGVRHESIGVVREPGDEARWTPTERTWGEFLDAVLLEGDGVAVGHKARANLYLETYVPVTAEAILRYGKRVAGTLRQVKQGHAVLLGTCLGHNGTAYRDAATHTFVKALLAQFGVEPLHPGRLLLRQRTDKNKTAWFFTNPTPLEVTEVVTIGSVQTVEDLLGEPFQREGEQVTLTVKPLDVRVLITTIGGG